MDVELIATITGLPVVRMDPTPLLKKDQEEAIAKQMKKIFGVQRSKRGFFIRTINNHIVTFVFKVLASKLLRKMHSEQFTTRSIALIELYAQGTQIN